MRNHRQQGDHGPPDDPRHSEDHCPPNRRGSAKAASSPDPNLRAEEPTNQRIKKRLLITKMLDAEKDQ